MGKCEFPRRDFLRGLGLGTLSLSLSPDSYARKLRTGADLTLYVGTFTTGKSEGIYIYRMVKSTGELKHLDTTKGVINPSFLAIDPGKRFLYAVNEVDDFAGKHSGAVSAFSINQSTSGLSFLNQQPSEGGGPCHLLVDNAGKFVLVANYLGGNLAVLPVRRDGSLGPVAAVVQHQGSGPNSERQQGPHAHCITLDHSNRYAVAADLGIDKVLIYRFDEKSGKLTANHQGWIQTKPGAGPRHFTFHPRRNLGYLINELDSTVSAFNYYPKTGELQEMQTISTLPAGFSGPNSCAEISVSPSGKFVYASNRGHDSIVTFAISEGTGLLNHIETVSTQGKTPRSFTIDPSGTFLLVANQNSDTVVTFRIDPETGRIRPTGQTTNIPTPVCLYFF